MDGVASVLRRSISYISETAGSFAVNFVQYERYRVSVVDNVII
jgi:hypothetical protein